MLKKVEEGWKRNSTGIDYWGPYRVLVLVSYPGVPQETRKTLLGAEAPRSVFRVRWAPGVKVKVRTPGVPLGPRV